jgi:hypothetical protein
VFHVFYFSGFSKSNYIIAHGLNYIVHFLPSINASVWKYTHKIRNVAHFSPVKKNDDTLLCSQDLDGERTCLPGGPDGKTSATGRGICAFG